MNAIVPAGMSYEFYTELTRGQKYTKEAPKVYSFLEESIQKL